MMITSEIFSLPLFDTEATIEKAHGICRRSDAHPLIQRSNGSLQSSVTIVSKRLSAAYPEPS